MPRSLTMSAGDWLLLLLLSVFWGGTFLFVAIAVREIPPFTLALSRVAIAAVLLALYLRATGVEWPRTGAAWKSLTVMAVTNNVIPFTLIFWSQKYIAGGLASILIAVSPILTIIVAHYATHDERITPARLVGVFAGLIGVIIVIGLDALQEIGVDVVAQLACLLASLSYAIAAVYGRRFSREPPAAVAAGTVTMSTLILLPLSLIFDQPWTLPMPSEAAIAAVLGLAVLSTAVAYIIYFHILGRAGATNILLVNFLIPVSAILLGATFLHETLAPRHFIGMIAITLGIAAIDGRVWRLFARSRVQ
jgi:drug/metabolite transporter (DMT)-like permease